MNPNPLARFFRQPAIYLKLPSQGRGWPAGSIDLPANGELPILPMTAMDEITYRTPDALFNGEATVSVIRSCVPNIQDPWAIPSIDLDAILIAIRIASVGHEMDLDSTCPKCQHENSFGLDLRTVLDKLQGGNFEQPLNQGDMTFYFRPLTYREMSDNSLLQFEQQKTIQMLDSAENLPDDQKVDQLNRMMKAMVELTVKALSHSISEIRLPDATVREHQYIEEFLNNCDRQLFTKVRDHVIGLKEKSELQPLTVTCVSCQNQYEQVFTLDMSRFFGPAS